MAEIPVSLKQIIAECDEFFNSGNLSAAGDLLRYWRSEAEVCGDWRSELSLLGELMGHYRMMNDPVRAVEAVTDGFALMQKHGETGSIAAGTLYLNGATALQFAGKNREAMAACQKALACYRRHLPENDRLFAGLFNNMASVYMAGKDFAEAERLYLKSLDILQQCGNKMDSAVTFVNLAQLYWSKGDRDIAAGMLDCAMLCFDDPAVARDGYYAHSCLKCAPAFREMEQMENSSELTRRAESIYERH